VVRDVLLQSIQTGPGAHSASYSMGTGDYFPGSTEAGREADHTSSCTAEVKNGALIHALKHKPS
jgi:hypothetical protein